MKRIIATDKAPTAPFLSQAIENNGLIFVSGQIHNRTDGTLVEGSVADKLQQIMTNIEAILAAGEARLSDIIKIVIYVTDMAQMPELNETYPTYFGDEKPVREAVCVSQLPLGATIELSVTASK